MPASDDIRRVLVVEDDAGARWALAALLRLEGFVVAEARNGAEAIRVVEIFEPDVVVSDVEMPEMGGLELCRWLRRASEAPVIVLMGARQPADTELAFVAKPLVLEILLEVIETAFRGAGP